VLRFAIPQDDNAPNTRASIASEVARLGLDVWAEHPEWIDVRATPEQMPQIDALGIPYSVLIEDLQTLIDQERASLEAEAANPEFFTTYRQLTEFEAFMDTLIKQYPNLVTKINIGQSVEGRGINGIVITSPDKTNGKTGIVFNGGQHAREWISPMTNAWIAYQLVTLYDEDELVTAFLDNFEYSIIPVLNPDGYTYTWSTDRMWRKNRRPNKDSWFGCVGVDNNRNWDFKWNQGGSSTQPCAETYCGPSGFSEPEELAIAKYIQSRGNVLGYIDFHAYGQLWMTPWGYTSTLPSDYPNLLKAARECVAALESLYGTKYTFGNIADTIYPASGSSVDWTYAVANVTYSFAVELRDTGRYGFVLPPSEIVPTGEETFAAVRAMSSYILSTL